MELDTWRCICCSPPKPSRDVIEVRYENGFVSRKMFVSAWDRWTSEWVRVIQWRPLSLSATAEVKNEG